MNAVLLVRFDNSSSYVIHNRQFIETNNGSSKTRNMQSTEELAEVIYDFFRIPTKVTHIALKIFSFEGNAWS